MLNTPAMKRTRRDLDKLFAVLLHLINISALPYSTALVSFLGILYNRILYRLSGDLPTLISDLKTVRRWFVELIRGGNLDNPWDDDLNWDIGQECPKLLSDMGDFIAANLAHLTRDQAFFAYRIFYTMLSCDRVMDVRVEANHQTITDGPTYDPSALPSAEEIRKALIALGISPEDFKEAYQSEVHDFRWELMTSRGPNGDATWSAHLDARAWVEHPELLLNFQAFAEESSHSEVMSSLSACITSVDMADILAPNPILGKFAYIDESGGKRRIVAQLDYWTQMLMSPLHDTINSFLRNMSQDGTFVQHVVASQVRSWTSSEHVEVYSYDLTAATDRLPITLQSRILEVLMGSNAFGANWAKVLTNRDFLTETGELVRYATGQPMGSRSSFPMLALTHHVIIAIAALRAGEENYRSYVVVGDDSTLTSEAVAQEYVTLMSDLGMTINEFKSVTHTDGALSAGELCKRVFIEGLELSMFNASLLVNTMNDGRLAADLQNDLFVRGWNPGQQSFWLFMTGVLDTDSLGVLIRLNLVPTAVSGLLSPIPPNTKLVDYKLWIPRYPTLTASDITELFTYIVASEQLKRLDAILRDTEAIHSALGVATAKLIDPKGSTVIGTYWLNQDLTPETRETFAAVVGDITKLSPMHPLILAASEEVRRVSDLLHQLNTLDVNMVSRARLGLLDMFRTTVSNLWSEVGGPAPTVNRALFQRMLTTLAHVFRPLEGKKEAERSLTLSYSVVLSTLSRLWSVSFTFGSNTVVNSLRASITRHFVNAEADLKDVLDNLSFTSTSKPLAAPKPQISGRAARRRRFAPKI